MGLPGRRARDGPFDNRAPTRLVGHSALTGCRPFARNRSFWRLGAFIASTCCGIQAEDRTRSGGHAKAARSHMVRGSCRGRLGAWTAVASSALCRQGVGSGKEPL